MMLIKWVAGAARVTSKGIFFNGLYYSCNKAIKEQWYHSVLQIGMWDINIKLDPTDLSTIKLVDFDEETCRRIQFNKFTGERLESYYSLIAIYKESLIKINKSQHKLKKKPRREKKLRI
ncbi:MAG: Mu transposase C-terminal domain-containing protein [Paenibacillaceae bacterium]